MTNITTHRSPVKTLNTVAITSFFWVALIATGLGTGKLVSPLQMSRTMQMAQYMQNAAYDDQLGRAYDMASKEGK